MSPLKNACRDVILSLALAHSLQEGNLAAAAGTGVHAVGVSRAAGVAGGVTGVGAVEISRVSIRVARASTKGGVAARIVAVHKTIVSAQENLI